MPRIKSKVIRVKDPDGIWHDLPAVVSEEAMAAAERANADAATVQSCVIMAEEAASEAVTAATQAEAWTPDAVNAWLDDHPDQKIQVDELGYVTPEMFGGRGDGVTDDTEAINDALSSGYDVYFQNGKTYVLKGIAEVKSNTHITIDGTVLMGATGLCGFEVFSRTTEAPGYSGVHNVMFDGCGTIDGNANLEGATDTLIRMGHCDNVTVRDITLCNYHAYHAMEISGCNNVLVDGIKIYGFIYDPNYQSSAEAINVERIINDTGSGGMIPYDNTQSNNITIQNCVFGRENSSLCIAIGNHNADYTDYPHQNLIIRNNIFRHKTVHPLYENAQYHKYNSSLLIDNTCEGLIISDNIFEDINGNAIFVGKNTKKTKITGNAFNKIYCFSIELFGGDDDILISDNAFTLFGYKSTLDETTNVYSAIYAENSESGLTISGNTFYVNAYSLDPIQISATASYPNLSIAGNKIIGLSDYAGSRADYSNAIARMDRYRNEYLFKAANINSIVKTGSITLTRDIREFDYLAIEYATELGNHETRFFDVNRALTVNQSFKLDFTELGGGTLRVFQMRLAFTSSNYKGLSVSQNRKYTVASNTITEYSTSGTDQTFIGVYSIRGINLQNSIT